MTRREWTVLLIIFGSIALLCGSTFLFGNGHQSEDRSADRTVRAYLDSLVGGDYDAAYALICTDETGVDQSAFESEEREDPIRSFEIEPSGKWSSWVDGHGHIYRVRVARTTGTESIEIRTQDADPPCIQHG